MRYGSPSIAHWLSELGLSEYLDVFVQQHIGVDIVRELADADLRALGMPLGDRKRLLRSIPGYWGPADASRPSAPRVPESGRRQLTVVFCDLVDSAELSQRLDPEEFQRLIRQYQDTCAGEFSRYEGYVAQYLGDGVLAYFGWPIALEGAAERAIRASLSVVERVAQLPAPGRALSVRIGVDTGLVVIGHATSSFEQDRTAVGDAPIIAARLQALAAPDTVVITHRTRGLVAGMFKSEDLGLISLKGIARQVHAWRAVEIGSAETRFDMATGGVTSPMVGRDSEHGAAVRLWESAKKGVLQMLVLCGEAGIGKSRLARALRDHCCGDGGRARQYQCLSFFSSRALHAVLMQFERALDFEPGQSGESKLDLLEAKVVGEAMRPVQDANLLARMLGLPAEARYGAPDMSPQKQKEETIRTLVDLVESACAKAPQILIFEDLHWADPTTLEFISYLSMRKTMAALVVLTHRPEFKSDWLADSHVVPMTLGPLNNAQTRTLAQSTAGARKLSQELLDQIASKTDGVPLFVEELTKTILESYPAIDEVDRTGLQEAPPSPVVPSSLRDSLLARLDRLDRLKETAQIGACIGREFSEEVLRLVSPLPASELRKVLSELVNSELVFQRSSGSDAFYVFKHALVQDTAYESLLKSNRALMHRKIGEVLEEHFKMASKPELLAHHFSEAGLSDKAASYWVSAGRGALERMALAEAITDLNAGVRQVAQVSTPEQRQILELELHSLLGTTWMAHAGWFNPNVREHLSLAWTRAQQLRRNDMIAPILFGLAMHAVTQGRARESLEWVQSAFQAADESKDGDMEVVAHMVGMVCLFWHGDLLGAKQHIDWLLGHYDGEEHRRIAQLTNHDPKTAALIYETNVLWAFGYPDRARLAAQHLDRHAESRRHFFDQGFAWTLGGWAHLYRGDANELFAFHEKAQRVGIEQGLPFFSHVQVPFHRGFHLSLLGKYEECIATSSHGHGLWQSLGANVGGPHAMAYWAEAEGHAGRPEEGLRVIGRALEQVRRSGWEERVHLAEVLRVEGWLLQQVGQIERAEQSLFESLQWSRDQRAKGWELRSAVTLARIWEGLGRQVEARGLLQPVYEWFTEGFDTLDMQNAAALIRQLS